MPARLNLSEYIFILAGVFTLAAIPFLEIGGFYLWLSVKSIYLLGLITLYVRS